MAKQKIFLTQTELKKLRNGVLGLSLRDIDRMSSGKIKATTLNSYETGARRIPLEKVLEIIQIYYKLHNKNMTKTSLEITNIVSKEKITPQDREIFLDSLRKAKIFSAILEKLTERIFSFTEYFSYEIKKFTNFVNLDTKGFETLMKLKKIPY